MTLYLLIALGGAFGAMGRYWLTTNLAGLNGSEFPYGTFLVNVLGSLLIGLAFVFLAEKVSFESHWRPLILVGFLGAFTTFSTFSLDALLLFQQGHYNTALLYIAGSVLICLVAVYTGMYISRLLFQLM